MNNFIDFLHYTILLVASKSFFLITEIFSCITLSIIGFLFIKNYINRNHVTNHNRHSFKFLLLILFSMIVENIAWIIKLSYQLEILSINYKTVQYLALSAWILNLVLYQSLGLFIENIIEKSFIFRIHQKFFTIINSILTIIFIHSGIAYIYNFTSYISIHTLFKIVAFYRTILVIPSIMIAFQKIYYGDIPSILKKQLTLFLKFILFPLLISDFIQCLPIFYQKSSAIADVTGFIAPICLMFLIAAIIFCIKNLIRFRFFNFTNKVQDPTHQTPIGNFKQTFEQLSKATSTQELIFITQTFFKENFNLSNDYVCLNFRYKQEICGSGIDNYCSTTSNIIESFITNKEDTTLALMQEYRILVADEIYFDAYYAKDNNQQKLANFLDNINSQIFLPMYDKENIIAYLTIKKNDMHKIYTHAEQHKIVIFGAYLASAINILHNNNTTELRSENKQLKEELYFKHQEINQYKESIKTILKEKSNNHIGILFYKNNHFTFGNQTAQNLLPINLNIQHNHPATIVITKLAQQVESFRSPQSRVLYDNNNKQIMINAIAHLDIHGGVILTIHHPDTSDIVKKHIDTLQDPSQIDYLFYLETTKAGQFINKIIPSNNEIFLNFKIKLLKIALQKKATLLQSHHDDVTTLAEIIHHISLRQTLHILELKPTTAPHDLSIKLFGLNPIFTGQQEESLLKKLDTTGTLFIKNIEYADLETQNKLAHFIRYGIFTILKSEQKISCDVRIICSINQKPQVLLEENKLSPLLYKELTETTLQMPSIATLNDQDLQELIEDYTHQTIQTHNFSTLLEFSTKEKEDFLENRPTSLQEFKLKIQNILTQKTKNDAHISHETHEKPKLNITDPKLSKAASLGKYALKDPEMMSMLWQEFQCQNKIAQFLGVNRSSVQRRCKEYNLY
ncbi:MAG: sigma 54-interacting transcriptional regulator [Candidatus Chromulinivorax sp.]